MSDISDHATGLPSDLARIPQVCPEGWCSLEKAQHLAQSVLDEAADVCVEIGVFGGRSLAALGLALRQRNAGLVYGVDPWARAPAIDGTNEDEYREWWSKLDYAAIHASCAKGLTELDLWRHVRLLATTSEVAAAAFPFESIDILHIDGNHSEKASVSDVHLWLPRVRPRGLIWFDDVNWPMTQEAVARLRSQAVLIADYDSYALFRKH